MPTAGAIISRLVPWRRPLDYRCVLLGAGWAGKTTLLYKLKCGEVVTTIPTIGFNCEVVECSNKAINFWDFGGCDKIAPLARHLLDSESAVLFLVDVTADEWLQKFSLELLEMHAGQLLDAGGQHFYVALAKQDLLPLASRDETVRKLKEEYEFRLRGFPQLKCKVFSQPGLSLLEDDFIWPIFDEIYADLKQQRKTRSSREKQIAVQATEMPTDDELIVRIRSEGLIDISASEFWKQLSTSQLPVWNHRNHLRAGYMIYLNVLSKMGSIWDAVEEFLKQLEQLRNSNPQRFTNTQHRTMTIFWLHLIRLAILKYSDEVNDGALLSAEDFQLVLLHTPSLMNGRIWQYHYTKALLFSPEAKEHWRLPDIAPLPDYMPKAPKRSTVTSESACSKVKDISKINRLPHFAFTVVQEYTSSNQRRGQIIKETLQALQSTTLQQRATDSSIPPYSETQAYFWIQITHAAVAGMSNFQLFPSSTPATAGAEKKVSIANMTFKTLSTLFPELLDENIWKRYYTAEVWNSVSARMVFKTPDIRPLPNVIGISEPGSIARATNKLLDEEVKVKELSSIDEDDIDDKDWIVVEENGDEKSKDDIEFRKARILGEITEIVQHGSKTIEGAMSIPEITTHAHLLCALFVLFSARSQTPSAAASEALSTLKGPQIPGLTQRAFWIQIFTAAFVQSQRDIQLAVADSNTFDTNAFMSFVAHHPQLLFEDLWTKYYSREIWESWDAKVGLVETDRGRLEGFLGPRRK